MIASIVSVGDELLIGQVVNSNASWLGAELTRLGYHVFETAAIGDVTDQIVNTLQRVCDVADVVIVTGGLGPTHDDLTRDAICTLLDCGNRMDPLQLQLIEDRFIGRGVAMNNRSRSQALLPELATPIHNHYGNAVGFSFTCNAATVFVLPGVPSEMKGMFNDGVLPALGTQTHGIVQTTFLTSGIAESLLADKLHEIYSLLDDRLTLAFLPSDGMLRLRLMCRDDDADRVERFSTAQEIIKREAADWLLGDSDEPVEQLLGRLLRERHLTIALAESCTGGIIGSKLTDIPGSSEYFLGGIVAYSYEAKEQFLNVPSDVLIAHGAVSREVVELMATGVRTAFGSDIGIGVTGIAGPGGGTSEKPVGTVWIGIASDSGVSALRFNLGNERDVVRRRTANLALVLTLKRILKPTEHLTS